MVCLWQCMTKGEGRQEIQMQCAAGRQMNLQALVIRSLNINYHFNKTDNPTLSILPHIVFVSDDKDAYGYSLNPCSLALGLDFL